MGEKIRSVFSSEEQAFKVIITSKKCFKLHGRFHSVMCLNFCRNDRRVKKTDERLCETIECNNSLPATKVSL